MPVTLKQVAQEAGVTHSTVSKVLNNRESFVGEEMRKNILETARRLNYRPNYFARSLKEGRTSCIGLVGSQHLLYRDNYYFSKTMESIDVTLSKNHIPYSLILFGANLRQTHEKSLELIRRGMVDGLILLILSEDLVDFEKKTLPKLKAFGLPFVVVHSTSRQLPYNNVGLDSFYGGYCAAEHLIKLGHKKIGFYFRDKKDLQQEEIFQGFHQALIDHSLVWDEKLNLYPVTFTGSLFSIAYQTIMSIKHLPEAILFTEDSPALGAIAACKERGIQVPEDVAIVGFDDEKPTPSYVSTLTTVHHPFDKKGEQALSILLRILNGKTDPTKITSIILKPHLVVRETSGKGR